MGLYLSAILVPITTASTDSVTKEMCARILLGCDVVRDKVAAFDECWETLAGDSRVVGIGNVGTCAMLCGDQCLELLDDHSDARVNSLCESLGAQKLMAFGLVQGTSFGTFALWEEGTLVRAWSSEGEEFGRPLKAEWEYVDEGHQGFSRTLAVAEGMAGLSLLDCDSDFDLFRRRHPRLLRWIR